MKRCQRCNLNFPDSLTFCESCGGGLGEAVSLRCPACGEAAQPGWKFCVKCRSPLPSSDTGDLSKATGRPAPPPTVPLVSPEISSTAPLTTEETTRSSQQPTITDTQIRVRCRSCRNLVDEDSEFCEFCGASMFEETVTTSTPPTPPPSQPPSARPTTPQNAGAQEWHAAPDRYQETYAPSPPPQREIPKPQPPPSHDRTPPTLSILSSYGEASDTPPASFRWWHGVILLVFFLLFVGALGAGAWWWWSSRSSTARSQAQPSNNPDQSGANPSTSSSPTASQRKSGQMASESSADADLKRLQERRSNAKPSDSEIVASIADAQKKYQTITASHTNAQSCLLRD